MLDEPWLSRRARGGKQARSISMLWQLAFAIVAALCVSRTAAVPYVPFGDYGTMLQLTNQTTTANLLALSNVTTLLGSLYIYGAPSPFQLGSNSLCRANITNLNATLTAAFANLREIRGSLYLGDLNCTQDFRFLRNLVVIRGTSRLPTGEALLVNASRTITQLGLASLSMVLGPVTITGNTSTICGKGTAALSQGVNYTSLVPGAVLVDISTSSMRTLTIDLLSSGLENVTVTYPFDSGCPVAFCDATCNSACWASDSSSCQQVCTASCGAAGCRNTSVGTCCPASCLGGCSATDECFACADGYFMMADGTCAATCPSPLLTVGARAVAVGGPCAGSSPAITRLVFAPFDCMASCPLDTYVWNNTCVRGCPDGNIPFTGVCPTGLAPRGVVCTGIDKVSSQCEAQIVAAQRCDVLVGSVAIDIYMPIAALPSLDNVGTLRVITGYIFIRGTNFFSLAGLSGVSDVDAFPPEPTTRTTINVQLNNGLQFLGLTQLRRLGGNALIIRNNFGLCLLDQVNRTSLFYNTTSPSYTFLFTLDYLSTRNIASRYEQAGSGPFGTASYWISNSFFSLPTCNQVSCSPMCVNRPCWSTSPADCLHCPEGQYLRNGTCVSDCNLNAPVGQAYYMANLDVSKTTDPYGCLPCHPSCATCSGSSPYMCTSCPANMVLRMDGSCMSVCADTSLSGQYVDPARRCQSCSTNCRYCNQTNTTCTQCSSRDNLFLFNSTCLGICPRKFYRFTANLTCAACDATCGDCTTAGSCTACDPPRYLQNRQCGFTCSLGTYPDNFTQTCSSCPTACNINCTGPTLNDCLTCNRAALFYSIPNTRTCVQLCPTGTYANATTGRCEDCVANCSRCSNPNTCTECRAPAVLTDASLCVAQSLCTGNTFQFRAATQTAPVVCNTLTNCTSQKYQSVPPTYSTDRSCADITFPCLNATVQYIVTGATATTDTVCAICNACASNQLLVEGGGCNGVRDNQCAIKQLCTPSPCLRSAPCINNNGFSFTCQCPAPFAGPTCELDTSLCLPNPCNNGTCQSLPNATFACTCPVNITGTLCNIDPRVCNVNPCLNNGTCIASAGFRATCDCIAGYTGGLCEASSASASAASFTVATYVGIAGGGVGGLIALLLLLILLVRRRNRKADKSTDMKKDYLTLRKADIDEWELDRTLLTLGKVIGAGQFGQVSKALYEHPSRQGPAMHVAVKLLKPGATGTNDEKDFFAEMRMMKQIGRHKHVLSLVGVCTVEDPVMIVLEYADDGDLRSYLRDRRPTPTHPAAVGSTEFVNFAFQIACGMEYLASLKIVHRDLAARNVLVAKGPLLKVADFGLARDVVEDNIYIKSSEGKVPFKWMAPEALNERIYTTQSDVWAFGITLWEISSYGATPYPGYENGDMFDLLESGYRMVPPDDCPDTLYKVMSSCWHVRPEDRPSFARLRDALAVIANISASYMSEVNLQRYTLQRKDLAPAEGPGTYAQANTMRDYLTPGLPVFATIEEDGPGADSGYVAPVAGVGRSSIAQYDARASTYEEPVANNGNYHTSGAYENPVAPAGAGGTGYAQVKDYAVNPLSQTYSEAVDFTPPGVIQDTDLNDGPAYSLAQTPDPLVGAGNRASIQGLNNPGYNSRNSVGLN